MPYEIETMDEVWGVRCAATLPLPRGPETLTPARNAPARRCANIYEMDETTRGNELQQKVLEYCVHGHAIRREDDTKGFDGAWWVPLRKLVRDIGTPSGARTTPRASTARGGCRCASWSATSGTRPPTRR